MKKVEETKVKPSSIKLKPSGITTNKKKKGKLSKAAKQLVGAKRVKF